jgi:DNA modification methylase
MTLNILDKSQWNRLIWGDNLLAMQALLANGYANKIDLIYIDPPFASKSDYTHQITVENKKFSKEASIIELLAYTDTWESGLDSYLDMIYPRLQLMKRLLSDTGSIYVHSDWRANSYLRLLLDEIFGSDFLVSEIIWYYSNKYGANSTAFDSFHNTIYLYSKKEKITYNPVYVPVKEARKQPYRKWNKELGKNEWQRDVQGNYIYVESNSKELADVWEIPVINPMAKERLGYSTQKPEKLLENVIQASSNEGDLVADFFCGSGTTMAVAERLNRRWIGCNLDKVGIQVSRNRLVEQNAKPFLLENIGNYQRHMIYLSGSKINEMQKIILKLYGAEPRSDRPDLGIRTYEDRDPELVYVGYPDRPVTARKVIELAKDAEILDGTGYKTLSVLAWDYDYNFSTELESQLKKKQQLNTEINPLTIPPEIYNYLKKAKNEDELENLKDKIVFHEKPYVRISKPEVRDAGNDRVVISLGIDRYVLMNFPIPENQQAELRKTIKDNFAALIDYWAIDWDYDGQTFKSRWQAIRGNGKQAKTVIITASSHELPAGKRTIAVRLVDVFGNDASATVEVK